MKKIYSVMLLVLAFAAAACTSDISDTDSGAQDGKISFTAVLNDGDATRVALSGLSPQWSKGDKIIAEGYDNAGNYLGETYLYPKEYGFMQTTVEGVAVKGAARYKMAVYSKYLTLSQDKKSFVMNYDGQLQTGSEISAAERILFETDYVTAADMAQIGCSVNFSISNALITADIYSLPEGVTSFDRMDVIVNYCEEGEKVIATTQYDGPMPQSHSYQNVYAAMPAGDVLKAGGTFAIRFATNLGNYVVHGTSAAGKTFVAGTLYTINVSAGALLPSKSRRWPHRFPDTWPPHCTSAPW